MTNPEKDELMKLLLFDEYQVKDSLDANVVKLQTVVGDLKRLVDSIQTLISYGSSQGLSCITKQQAADYQRVCPSLKIEDLKMIADETLQLNDRLTELRSRKKRLRLGGTP